MYLEWSFKYADGEEGGGHRLGMEFQICMWKFLTLRTLSFPF